jgi:bifunctional ADP-heptose synthase (sugar kinase/adenylyltransferase)
MSLREAIAGARVLVAGDVMLDRYWFGDVSRISPEAPVPVALHRRDAHHAEPQRVS